MQNTDKQPAELHVDKSHLAALCAGLETLETAALLLAPTQEILYLTSAAATLLGLVQPEVTGQNWQTFWNKLNGAGAEVPDATPRRFSLVIQGQALAVRVWQRPVAGSDLSLVRFEDLSAEEAREQESRLIFDRLQAQADDLFALYQITQFLSTAQELDQLCTNCLRELERLTEADLGCLYLSGPVEEELRPKSWHGLAVAPPPQPDSETATVWFRQYTGQREVITLPLLAEKRPVGLILLGCRQEDRRELRFLSTVSKEMGAAIQAMLARQALIDKEHNLEAIVTGTTDAIIQIGADRLISDFNPAAESLTGYSAAEVLGQSCAEVLRCGEASGCGGSCIFSQVLAVGEPIPYTELLVAGRNGPRHLAASVTALRGNLPVASAAVAILRDITRQKQIEQMKSDFTAMVSHQLRTPLALLRGYSDTLQHLELSPREQQTCLNGMAETIVRLQQLVEQILDVSRIEAGRMGLERRSLDLAVLVRQTVSSLAQRERVRLELPADLPQLYADGPRLEQVLLNLLDNALKYSPAERPVFIRVESAGPEVVVQVRDQGIGVPPAEVEILFNKFQRASNARHLQLPGTGLGLFICRNIIEAHGGRIKLVSEPGQGSCITFWLPVGDLVDEG